MKRKEFLRLLDRYQNGTASKEEVEFLHAYYNLAEIQDDPLRSLDIPGQQALKTRMKNVIDREIGQGRTATPMERRSYTPWLSVAAALLLAGAVAYLLMPVQKEAGSGVEETIAAPIVPGKNQATLVLEDGAVIPLSSHQEGIFVHANGIRYLDGTALAGKTGSTSRHTITTPKGGQYQVILPDGSRVWLNAASTLIYPVVFDDNRREVELIGEALFDIEPGTGTSAGKPFVVKTPQQQIDVLGTSFVVSVYPDEPEPRTILLDGAVRVSHTIGAGTVGKQAILKPGFEAVVSGNTLSVQKADEAAAVAWTKGYFKFNGVPIEVLMRQVARWYDVEVEYRGEMPEDLFAGELDRSEEISRVLKILELSNLKTKIEGRKVIISP